MNNVIHVEKDMRVQHQTLSYIVTNVDLECGRAWSFPESESGYGPSTPLVELSGVSLFQDPGVGQC